ncbi:MAG: TIGR03752 family integrating conjugative element protein [Thalassospira sp.]|uniref:TIGR03752 family integrating conjugative element protein n=1 Tax=Thalassospira sp. TaxID=1912094 RepID=UPI003A83C927
MPSNIIIKVIVGVVILGVIMVWVFNRDAGEAVPSSEPAARVGGQPLDEETLAAIGVEGDTPEDVVRTLVSNVREQNRRYEELATVNEQLRADNAALLNMQDTIWQRLSSDVRGLTNTLARDQQAELVTTRNEMQRLLDQARTQSHVVNSATVPVIDTSGITWLSPLDGGGEDSASTAGRFNVPWSDESSVPSSLSSLGGGGSADEYLTPAYTIAKNSTLVGATAFTALIGRVPVGDNVVDPYTFKVLIGRDNLIANGQEVPEFAYAVVSGKAVGDWTLGCVSGDVFSMTFVFPDGRITTIPEPKDIRDGATNTPDLKIGELSDDVGNPCVVGKKISNARKYLVQRVGAVAAGAAARAAAAAETTTTLNSVGGIGVGGTTIVTGDKSEFVLDETLAGAALEAAQWIRDRQALEFDAIYVEPGAKVAIHVTEELRIDYNEVGRKTHHAGFFQRGAFRELD